MKIKIITATFLASVMVSCNTFLDEPSSKSSNIKPETVEQLEGILNNYNLFYREWDHTVVHSSDDFGIYPEIEKEIAVVNIERAQLCFWDVDNIPNSIRHSWSGEWEKVFNANMILDNLRKVTGSEEKKEELRLECHFLRAYTYLKIIGVYCLPYCDDNKGELGLPIRKTISFTENIKRATLEESYAFIEEDLKIALEISSKMRLINDKIYSSWRASKGAVNALAARFWLLKGDYKKALEYAEVALSEHSVLRDYNTEMRYSSVSHDVSVGGVTHKLDFPYTYDNPMVEMLEWKEFYYFRAIDNIWYWAIPSESLLSTYDQEYDLRFKYHIVEKYSYSRSLSKHDLPGYVFFSANLIPSGMSVGEMLLTKAECQIRTGKWQEGLVTANLLRVKRMSSDCPTINLTATSQAEALKVVLEERRRELPFTMRWSDIRRFNNNENPEDDVVIKKQFYPFTSSVVLINEPLKEYVLEPKSRKYACPLPQTDIDASNGQLIQNKY